MKLTVSMLIILINATSVWKRVMKWHTTQLIHNGCTKDEAGRNCPYLVQREQVQSPHQQKPCSCPQSSDRPVEQFAQLRGHKDQGGQADALQPGLGLEGDGAEGLAQEGHVDHQ